ncbi:MAG: OOP family OmpA-OmpF porin [Cellvibrionaceae bacterium]|jgi:OOP family OmpA-OmpF porin
MINKITLVSSIALTSVLMSVGASAHVANGALVDGSGNPIKSSYTKCIKVSSGKFFSRCQDIKPKVIAAPARVAAPAPKVAAAPTKTVEKVEQKISLAGDALFATNSAILTDAGKASVDPVVVGVRALSDYNLSLFGHADSRGNDAYNMSLSESRAQSVADYLVSKGVPASAISVYGRGETEPVTSNASREGRAKNRRVDVTVSGTKVTYK